MNNNNTAHSVSNNESVRWCQEIYVPKKARKETKKFLRANYNELGKFAYERVE